MKSWCRRSFLHVECYWQIMETLLHTFCYSWKAVLWWSDILAVHAGNMAHSFTHFAGSRHRISYSPTQQGAHVYTYHIILSIKCLNCTCIHIPILYYPWGKNSLEKTPQRSEAKQFQEHFLGHESTASMSGLHWYCEMDEKVILRQKFSSQPNHGIPVPGQEAMLEIITTNLPSHCHVNTLTCK